MKPNWSLILSVAALVLLGVAQALLYRDSGWNAGLILLAALVVLFNVTKYLRRS